VGLRGRWRHHACCRRGLARGCAWWREGVGRRARLRVTCEGDRHSAWAGAASMTPGSLAASAWRWASSSTGGTAAGNPRGREESR
jgi:hypothetical protein